MIEHSVSRRGRAALGVAVAAGVLLPTAVTATPAAAADPVVTCTSVTPGLAAKLSKDLGVALRGRASSVAVSLYDRKTGTSCAYRAASKYDSASVVKVTVLGALLYDAQKQRRTLTATEKNLASAMITKSDNDSTTKLWRQLGVTKVKAFLTATKMTQTVPGSGGYWGLTQITARDQARLLSMLITANNGVLTEANRQYVLYLMRAVVPSQRWGVPAGAPSGIGVQVKNGWLPRATHAWRVHSIGAFIGGGRSYTLTVLSQDNATMNDGVNTIQSIARIVHRDLNPGVALSDTVQPPAAPQEAVPAVPEAPGKALVTAATRS
ncbi:serine hydrolase [Streptomyces purpureus]|uniref:Beta-lactamase n=1 Tax=Streptomyces purpureus TaxID=1951 RepID=A0A918H1W5_9ACTN|nr:hypothetical protein GCM10014713_22470 [Streptomyces purpureus]